MSNPGDLSLDDRLERIEEKLDSLIIDVTTLRARAAVWGAFMGIVVSVAVTVISSLIQSR